MIYIMQLDLESFGVKGYFCYLAYTRLYIIYSGGLERD